MNSIERMITVAENILNKAFDGIVDKVEKALSQQGFTKLNVASDKADEKVALFSNDTVAYSVIHTSSNNHMMLRSCGMTDEGPDNDWKNLATWLFDPENDTMKDAESIGKDFSELLSGSKQIKKVQQAKKKKKNKDEGNADPEFLAKRFVTFFPELKDEIKAETDAYYPMRGVTFAKNSLVPKIQEYMKKANKKEVGKLATLLERQYGNGDLDTRSIINIVILNSLSDEDFEKLCQHFDEDMQKYSRGARKYKGKKVQPEKPKKKKRSFMADTLKQQ